MPPSRGSLKRRAGFPPGDQVQVTLHTASRGASCFSSTPAPLQPAPLDHDRRARRAGGPAPPARPHPPGPRCRGGGGRRRGGGGDGRVALVTTDTLVEGVHFRREWAPAALLGRKALSVNLSDIAAMAGVPRYATVSLVPAARPPWAFVDELYDGLLGRCRGDGGEPRGRQPVRRPGADRDRRDPARPERRVRAALGRPAGDLVVVTGTLGARGHGAAAPRAGSAAGRRGRARLDGTWTESSARRGAAACARSSIPRPPLAFARALAEPRSRARGDRPVRRPVRRPLARSARRAASRRPRMRDAMPVEPRRSRSSSGRRGGDALALALHGGEDYQLLLAVPADASRRLRELAAILDLPLTVLGEFRRGRARASSAGGRAAHARRPRAPRPLPAGSEPPPDVSRIRRPPSRPAADGGHAAPHRPRLRHRGLHRVLPDPRHPHRDGAADRVRLPLEPGGDPRRGLDEQPLDPRPRCSSRARSLGCALLGVPERGPPRHRLDLRGRAFYRPLFEGLRPSW